MPVTGIVFDFWNSCKRLQNFVSVEALPAGMAKSSVHIIVIYFQLIAVFGIRNEQFTYYVRHLAG